VAKARGCGPRIRGFDSHQSPRALDASVWIRPRRAAGITGRRRALSTGARPRSGALGPVAQLGGHLVRNQEIAGSSPARSTVPWGMASPALVAVGTEVSGGGPLKSAGGLAPSSRGRSSSRRASVWQTEGSGCESPRLHGGYRSRWATRLEPGGAVARRGSIPLPSATINWGCRHLVKPLDCRSREAGSIPVSPAGRYGSRRPERSAKASGLTAARVRVPHLPLEGPSCTGARCSPGTRVATARGLWVRFPPLPPGRGLDGKPLASDARVVRVRLPSTRPCPRSVFGDAPGLYPGESGSTPGGGSEGPKVLGL
jgi:hypothetical protein